MSATSLGKPRYIFMRKTYRMGASRTSSRGCEKNLADTRTEHRRGEQGGVGVEPVRREVVVRGD